jgi:hypothetical protein
MSLLQYQNMRNKLMKKGMEGGAESTALDTEFKEMTGGAKPTTAVPVTPQGNQQQNVQQQTSQTTQPTSTGLGNIKSADNVAMMQLQAKLIATEMKAMQTDGDYVAKQEEYAKKTGVALYDSLFSK